MTPNVLFIVADDLNAWIGALGRHPNVSTPNIDALAKRGTLFSHAYCAAPYCNASRMSVFSGLLPSTTGIYQNEEFWKKEARPPTFIEHLRRRGYHTAGAGKVFHGAFDYATAGAEKAASAQWRDQQNCMDVWDSFQPLSSEPVPAQRPLNGLFDFDRFAEVPPSYHHFDWGVLPDDREEEMPDVQTVRAFESFVKHPPNEPFFFAAGLYKPHLPWYVPKRFFDRYPLDSIVLPPVKIDDLDDVPPIAREWATSPPDHEYVTRAGQWHTAVQGYLASISFCDEMVGRLMRALDESGRADDTLVILWGDNGFHLGEKLHWRKFVLWEEATRVPLIIVPPANAKTQAFVHQPVSLIDIFPTVLEMCGVDAVEGIDGESLVAAMSNAARRSAPAFTTWGAGNHSVCVEEWRYTRYVDGGEELYHHPTDPHEWTNLVGDARFEADLERLRRLLPRDRGAA